MRFLSGRVLFGLAVLVIGIILLLGNLGVDIDIEVRQILRLWPVIPLVIGLNWLYLSFGSTSAGGESKIYFSWGQFITALIVLAIGIIFLGRNLGLFEVDTSLLFSIIWPVVLIMIGISLIRGRAFSGRGGGRFAFMGGANVGGAEPWTLENGSYFALMGGIEIDLTAAELKEGETILDLTAIMGGIEVKIPKNLPVIYEGSAVLGGVTFKNQEDGGIVGGRKIEYNISEGAEKIVRLQARAIMGGVEIKEA